MLCASIDRRFDPGRCNVTAHLCHDLGDKLVPLHFALLQTFFELFVHFRL